MSISMHRRIGALIRSRLRSSEGFSLVELLVAMLVMVLVLFAIYGIWSGLQRTYSFTDEDMKAQREARAALSEMVEFIRTARQPDAPPSDALDLVIVSADATELVCWTDVDRDAAHDLELVRFRVDTVERTLYRDDSQTGDLTFSEGYSTRLVGNWVSNNEATPLFTYKSINGASLASPIAEPMNIGQVHIDLYIDIEAGKSPIAHQLSSVVQPRNLRQ
jgi:prepilin-type N-terminal cleavage/methylation domain-containing protein